MKVKFKYGIGSFAGTLEAATFYETPNGGASFMRKWVMPKITDNNIELGSISKNLSRIWKECSTAYKADMLTYCDLYRAHFKDLNDEFQGYIGSYAMFVKMFYAFADANGEAVDLKSLSYGDLATLFPEILSVAASTDYGFIPPVPGAELLTENM